MFARKRIQRLNQEGAQVPPQEPGPECKKNINHGTSPPSREPTMFQEVLEEWGNTWMWEGLRISGDGTWVREAIRDNSLVAVTDGSYMKDLFPNMNSCAFIFECTKKRGRMTGAFPEQTAEAGSY